MKFLTGLAAGILLSVPLVSFADFVVKDFHLENRRADWFLDQLVNRVNDMTKVSTYTVTNGTTDRTYDADATGTAELADVLSTLISDLQGAQVLK